MTNKIYIVCPWIPSDGYHAGYEVLQSYQNTATKLGVEMQLVILGRNNIFLPMMKISRWLTRRNLYSFCFILNLVMTFWVFLYYRNQKVLLYIEPDYLRMSQYLAKLITVGIIVHDDPISYLKRTEKKQNTISRSSRMFENICHDSNCGIFISDYMLNSYDMCHGPNYQAIHISYDTSPEPFVAEKNGNPNRIGVFGTPLTGSLDDKDSDPIINIAKVLGINDEIWLFNTKIAYTEQNIKTHKWLEQDIYLEKVKACNLSLVDDQLHDEDFANYSFPTKLVFSIFNGLPVLYSGPQNSAVGQFVLKEKIGLLISPVDLADLKSKISQLKENAHYYRKNSRASYTTHFRQELQLEKLSQVLEAFNV